MATVKRPKRTAGKEPRPFLVCIESLDRADKRVWAVKQGRRWRLARDVRIFVPTFSVFKGRQAPQPQAYLEGVGVVTTLERGIIVITA